MQLFGTFFQNRPIGVSSFSAKNQLPFIETPSKPLHFGPRGISRGGRWFRRALASEVFCMFGLTRTPRRSARASRLRFESLETRDCPAAPSILAFNLTRLQGHAIQVSGLILDESPGTAQVR